MARVKVRINKRNGQVQIAVAGKPGKGCTELTKQLEAALGGKVLDREHTREYSQPATGETLGGLCEQD